MTRDTGKSVMDALLDSGYGCSMAVSIDNTGGEHASIHVHEMRLTVGDLSAIHKITQDRGCEMFLHGGELRVVAKAQ